MRKDRKRQRQKNRNRVIALTAAVLLTAATSTGAFAWQSATQVKTNEFQADINPGGRLHDDFNGSGLAEGDTDLKNKDVYVENFTQPDDGGTPIFVRVRLDEYMELGPGAGDKDDPAREAKSLVAGTDINDVTTWTTHIPETAVDECSGGGAGNGGEAGIYEAQRFHTCWQWAMGGSTVYMPTFNRNKDSLAADINGSLAGRDGIAYGDYIKYIAGDTKTGDEIYDADNNDVDEGASAQKGINFTVNPAQTHTATQTKNAQVITMAEWKNSGSPIGDYWVYDIDGWAYWASPLMPGEATGLLLDGIKLRTLPEEDWYYSINAVAQFATACDWGEDDGTGFFDETAGNPPTADALTLLNRAAEFQPV